MSPVSPITWSSCACLCSQNPANSTHSPTDKSPMEQAHPWPIGERGLYSGCSTSHFLCFSTQVTPLAETHWAEGPFWGGYQLHLHIKSQSKEEILPRRGEGPSQAAGARFPAVLHLLEWNNWPALNTRPRVQSWARGQHRMFTVRYLIRTVSLIAITCPCLQDKRNEYWKPSQKQECVKEVSDSERQEEGEIQTHKDWKGVALIQWRGSHQWLGSSFEEREERQSRVARDTGKPFKKFVVGPKIVWCKWEGKSRVRNL